MQYTKAEVNAAIAKVMDEENLQPLADYLDDPIDSERFIQLAETAIGETNDEFHENYTDLCDLLQSKVIALVSILGIMQFSHSDRGHVLR